MSRTERSASLLRDVQEERERWAEFEHRDGFYSGFICGAGFAVVVLLVTLFVVGFF